MPLFFFPIKTPHHWFWDKAKKVPVCVDKIINNDIQFVFLSFLTIQIGNRNLIQIMKGTIQVHMRLQSYGYSCTIWVQSNANNTAPSIGTIAG